MDVKAFDARVSFVGADRVVFNIAGNKYRLIVYINYTFKTVYVCFAGGPFHAVKNWDAVDAILFVMKRDGLTCRELEPFLGSDGRVSELLNRKRRLSLAMVVAIHAGLKIPWEILLRPSRTRRPPTKKPVATRSAAGRSAVRSTVRTSAAR